MRVVLCNAPPDRAAAIARSLVEERLAACVSQTPVRSTYRWQGALHSDDEVTLFIKTTDERLAALRARLGELHPYELPEILALPVDEAGSLARYLDWVRTETT